MFFHLSPDCKSACKVHCRTLNDQSFIGVGQQSIHHHQQGLIPHTIVDNTNNQFIPASYSTVVQREPITTPVPTSARQQNNISNINNLTTRRRGSTQSLGGKCFQFCIVHAFLLLDFKRVVAWIINFPFIASQPSFADLNLQTRTTIPSKFVPIHFSTPLIQQSDKNSGRRVKLNLSGKYLFCTIQSYFYKNCHRTTFSWLINLRTSSSFFSSP